MGKDKETEELEKELEELEKEEEATEEETEPAQEGAEPEGDGAGGEEEPEGEEEPPSDIESLKAELAELKNANRGLLTTIQEERRRRQEHDGRFAQLTELLQQARAKSDGGEEKSDQKKIVNLPFEVDEDGNIVTDEKAFKEFLKKSLGDIDKPVQEIREELDQTRAYYEQERAFNRIVQDVVSKDESYPQAYQKLQRAADWINQQVIAMQEAAGIPGEIPTNVALEALAGTQVEQEFQKMFPGVDFERTVRAYDSKYDLARAVDSFAKAGSIKGNTAPAIDPKKAKATMRKPAGPGGVKNVGAVGDKISADNLPDITPEDIMRMTPAEREKLERILEQEGI